MQFSVCALGDTNYEQFCAFGKVVDARMETLGAKRVLDRVDCDTDYDGPFATWVERVFNSFSNTPVAVTSIEVSSLGEDDELKNRSTPGTKANPFIASLTLNQLLTAASAAKETRHFEININGLNYEVGDALGVVPTNDIALVDAVLGTGQWSSDDTLRHDLLNRYDLTNPGKDLLQAVAERAKHDELLTLLKPDRSADLKKWLYGRDVLDVLQLSQAWRLERCRLRRTAQEATAAPVFHRLQLEG